MYRARNIQYAHSDRVRGLASGGIGAMHQLAQHTGLVDAIDRHVEVLKVALPYHESDHVLGLAYNVLCGGTCLQDIERLRQDEVYLDALGTPRIPDPTTAGDFCRRFNAPAIEALQTAINEQLFQDTRFGLRQMIRSPLTATVAVLALAIGIGLNTAVFSLVHAVLLRPLPYPGAERLVWITPHSDRWQMDTSASRGDYLVWRQQAHAFERMAAYGTQDLNLLVGGEASQERVASTGGDFWEITGGRSLTICRRSP